MRSHNPLCGVRENGGGRRDSRLMIAPALPHSKKYPSLGLLDPFLRQPAFCVDGSFAAHAGGGDGLAVDGVGAIAGGEDAVDAGGGAIGVAQHDVALGIELELALE